MKKIFLVITFLLTAQYMFAQNVNFGIQGGINMPSIGPTAPQSGGASSQAHATFAFGALVDIGFKNLSLQPGVFLTGKGNMSTTTEDFISNGNPVPYNLRRLTNITYLEVPVNLLYKYAVKPGKLYVGGGPYIAHALWASFDTHSDLNEYYKRVNSTGISFGNGSDQLKSMDFGINFLAGLEMNNGLKLGLNYGLGLSNITNSGTSSHNRVLGLIVGYSFK